MSLFKIIMHSLIITVIAGFYGCGGTAVELMKEQIQQQLEDQYGLQLEKEPKVVEPKVVKAVEDSAKWEQNKLESAKRYAIWDNWRNQNYEYQNNDRELKIRLSFEFRSDYFMGEGVPWSIDDEIPQISEFEIMIQNKTDSKFNLFVNNQDFKFLIDGKERTYGSFKYTYGETENNSDLMDNNSMILINENSKEYMAQEAKHHYGEFPEGYTPAEGLEFELKPYGSYDRTGMNRTDLVILKFRYYQPLSMASKESIWKDYKDILEEEIIPIMVDAGKYNSRSVTVLLNGKKYYLSARHGWNGLPFVEDKALHDEIKLNPEITSISKSPNWRGMGLPYGESNIYTLHRLRWDFLNGKDHASIGCDMEAKKKAFEEALRLADEVSKKSDYKIDGRCEGKTSEKLFKAYQEYGACLVAGKEKNEIMKSMNYLEMACAGIL